MASKALLVLIFKVLSAILGMLSSIFIGRVMGDVTLGNVGVINSIVATSSVIGSFGLNVYYIKEVNTKNSFDRIVFLASLGRAIMFSGVIIAVLVFSYLTLIDYSENGYSQSLKYLAVVTFFMIFNHMLMAHARAIQSLGAISFLMIVPNILKLVLISFAIIKPIELDLFLTLYMASFAVTPMLYFTACNALILKRFIFKGRICRQLKVSNRISPITEMYKIGFPFILVEGVLILFINIDVFVLNLMSSASKLGIYTVALSFIAIFTMIQSSAQAFTASKIAQLWKHNDVKSVIRYERKITIYQSSLSLLFFSLVALVGDFAIRSLYGQDFSEAHSILLILSSGYLLKSFFGVPGLVLNMTGFEKLYSKISITWLIFNCVMSVVLFNIFGSNGVAVATSLSIVFLQINLKWRLNDVFKRL